MPLFDPMVPRFKVRGCHRRLRLLDDIPASNCSNDFEMPAKYRVKILGGLIMAVAAVVVVLTFQSGSSRRAVEKLISSNSAPKAKSCRFPNWFLCRRRHLWMARKTF